jgi:uncharacterized membrane protein
MIHDLVSGREGTKSMESPIHWLVLAAALGTGGVAGVLFAFSSFVMLALSRLPAAQGLAAMQSINRYAVTPPFMGLFFGSALMCLALAAVALMSTGMDRSLLIVAAGTSYLIGVIGVTVSRNVPLNNQLEGLAPEDANAQSMWTTYAAKWTVWNHLRTGAAFLSTLLFMVAIAG